MRTAFLIVAAAVAMLALACGDDSPSSVAPTVMATAPPVEPGASLPSSTPTAAGSSTAPAGASATASVAALSIEVRVGQLIAAGVPGTVVGAQAEHLLGELHIGNVVVMGENAGTLTQVAEFTAQLQGLALQRNGVGALIATDQEGGLVQRLREGFTRLPDAAAVGAAAGRPGLARQYGELVGSELSAVGVNMALGPVLDVNDNPANPVIGRRAFGTTVDAVVGAALPYIEGLHALGVIAVGKHFPGHGNTETDSHFTLPVVRKPVAELEATELAPFTAAMDAGLDVVMVAHVAYPSLDASGLPASLSPTIGRMLKQELGPQGVVVTDDLGMAGVAALMTPEEAALRAVQAGADLVICVSAPCDATRVQARLLQAVRSGELSEARLNDAVRRVLELKQRYAVGSPGRGRIEDAGSAAHQAVIAEILDAN